MTNVTDIYVLNIDDLDALLQDEGLEHDDSYRLLRYIWLVASWPYHTTLESYRDNLKKWIDDEQDAFYGTHESPAEFVRYYFDQFVTEPMPNWVVIDYQATWDSALRHDFHFEETDDYSGYVWAEIY